MEPIWGDSMARKDFKNFRNINELWNEKAEGEFESFSSDDPMEDFKIK